MSNMIDPLKSLSDSDLCLSLYHFHFLDALASLESVMRVTHNFFVRYQIKGFQTSDLKL